MTQLLAVWGAITGSLALLWDFYKWKTSGPQLHMTAFPNMIVAEPGVGVGKTLHIAINVTNTGTAKTTLTSLTLVSYRSLWAQLRQQSTQNFVVINTWPFCRPLPHVLDVGEEWKSFLQQDVVMKGVASGQRIFFQLYHSARKKSVSARITIPARG